MCRCSIDSGVHSRPRPSGRGWCSVRRVLRRRPRPGTVRAGCRPDRVAVRHAGSRRRVGTCAGRSRCRAFRLPLAFRAPIGLDGPGAARRACVLAFEFPVSPAPPTVGLRSGAVCGAVHHAAGDQPGPSLGLDVGPDPPPRRGHGGAHGRLGHLGAQSTASSRGRKADATGGGLADEPGCTVSRGGHVCRQSARPGVSGDATAGRVRPRARRHPSGPVHASSERRYLCWRAADRPRGAPVRPESGAGRGSCSHGRRNGVADLVARYRGTSTGRTGRGRRGTGFRLRRRGESAGGGRSCYSDRDRCRDEHQHPHDRRLPRRPACGCHPRGWRAAGPPTR